MSNFTLADYNEQILEPMVKAMESKAGKPRQQLIAEYDRMLTPHRKIMASVRKAALKE